MPRLISGEISYCNNPAGKTQNQFGREIFSVSVQANGIRTLRVLCEFDNLGLTRDVTYTVGPDWRPLECYVRIAEEQRELGSGWFRFTPTSAEGEAFTHNEGRFSQRIALDKPVNAFGAHPICCDIWKLAHVETVQTDNLQIIDNCFNSSTLSAGNSGPIMAPRTYDYWYRGEETLTVKSGTYHCHKFEWPVRDGKTLIMWTTLDDYLPVRMTYPEGERIYDLVELEVRE
jgi:hypothetical protein